MTVELYFKNWADNFKVVCHETFFDQSGCPKVGEKIQYGKYKGVVEELQWVYSDKMMDEHQIVHEDGITSFKVIIRLQYFIPQE